MKSKTFSGGKAIAVGSLALLLPASQVILLGWPRFWAPFPIVLVFPLFEGIPWPVVVVAPALGFLLTASLVLGRLGRTPLLSFGIATVLLLLHTYWLAASWRYGLQWQGVFHTVFVATTGLLGIAGGSTLLFLAWRRKSLWLGFWGHWAVFAWLAWLSFPYLGELP